MQIRILTSCTGAKRYSPDNQLAQDDFRYIHMPEIFSRLEDKLAKYRIPAKELYTGQQHMRLMKGVQQFVERQGENNLDLWILSAGYGLIPGNRKIVPYECSFEGMKIDEVSQWAEHLCVPQTARYVFAQKSDLILVLLGDRYLRALSLNDSVHFAAPTIFLASKSTQKHIKGQGQIRVVILSQQEAKRFSYGLVGLKGEIGKRLLHHLAERLEIGSLMNADILAILETIS